VIFLIEINELFKNVITDFLIGLQISAFRFNVVQKTVFVGENDFLGLEDLGLGLNLKV